MGNKCHDARQVRIAVVVWIHLCKDHDVYLANFFPHISIMKVFIYITFALTIWFILNILLFAKRKYVNHRNRISIIAIIVIVVAISLQLPWQDIMDNALKIMDNRFWIESLKLSVNDLEYDIQQMDYRITQQIDVLNEKYGELLQEMESIESVDEFVSKTEQIDDCNQLYSELLEEMETLRDAKEFYNHRYALQMWEEMASIAVHRRHFVLGHSSLNTAANATLFRVTAVNDSQVELVNTSDGGKLTVTKLPQTMEGSMDIGFYCGMTSVYEVKKDDMVLIIEGWGLCSTYVI